MKSKPKILIVDDNIENLVVMETLLANLHVELILATSDDEVSAQGLKSDLALAIVAANLPDMDGFKTIEILHQDEQTKNLPIIFITTVADQNYSIEAIEKGAVDVITRPIIPQILLSKVNVFLNNFEQSQALQESNEKLNLFARELEKQNKNLKKKLEDSNAELQQFAYIVSHDLQEPLRMVSSYCQLLAQRYADKLDQDANEFIEFAVDGSQRMKGLITDLLKYSRVGTQGKPFENVDLNSSLGDALANLNMAIDGSGAVVTSDQMPALDVDKRQFVQLLQNLIGNALKFGNGKQPKIHVGTKREENSWLFSVKDNGIGIDLDFQDKVFGVFQRSHTKDQHTGNGIGLAVCKRIVERHGGRIWVESEPEKGATFYFNIPVQKIAQVNCI